MNITDLTSESVSILSNSNGINSRCAYANNARGRAELAADCPSEIVGEVLALWGDTPTVMDVSIQTE